MANPTSNFNWQMPTASDLVTDLPADFEVFGQAVDTSLADLKGGTTDQVLAKNSNTDMDFKWVTSDDANAIQNSIVDAKGDLIAASANDTPARLAVGTNGQVLTADSTAATGLKWAAASGGSATYVGVSAYKTSNQDISNNTFTALTFQAESFDTDSFHDNSTNTSRFTVPTGKGGKYVVSGTVSYSTNATGARAASIYKNGAVVNYHSILPPVAGGVTGTYVPVSYVLSLAAGDYVEIFGWQTSGGNLAVTNGGSGNEPQATNIQMSYLGA